MATRRCQEVLDALPGNLERLVCRRARSKTGQDGVVLILDSVYITIQSCAA